MILPCTLTAVSGVGLASSPISAKLARAKIERYRLIQVKNTARF